MRNGAAFWLICLSLVFTRLVGLHLHACAGVEAGVQHAGTHLADSGFLLGDHHSEDDGDDREVESVVLLASKIQVALPDLAAPLHVAPSLDPLVERLLAVIAPRGPPLAGPTSTHYFSPPARGPPVSLA